MMTRSPFISFAETARLINRSLTTVKRLVKEKVFPTVPMPVRPMILREAVEAFIARATNGHHHEPEIIPVKQPPGVEKRGRGRPRKQPQTRKRRAS